MSEKPKNVTKQDDVFYNKETALLERIMNFQHEDVGLLKTKKAYGYNYSPLDEIIPIILPLIKKHGIGYVHETGHNSIHNKPYLKTTFFSIGNSSDTLECYTIIDDDVQLAKMNKFMVIGSAMTYYRRYHVTVTLGLTSDEDTDAGGAVPSQDQKKTKSKGRSVEAAAKTNDDINYVPIIENLINKGKTKDQVVKTYELYKKNMSTDDIKKIDEIILSKFKDEKK